MREQQTNLWTAMVSVALLVSFIGILGLEGGQVDLEAYLCTLLALAAPLCVWCWVLVSFINKNNQTP